MEADELKVIDADGHLTEPGDLWQRYISPRYRDTCPLITFKQNGAAVFRITEDVVMEENLRPHRPGINTSSIFGARTGEVPSDTPYMAGARGGFDPHERLAWMDREGFDATILYPTLAFPAVQVTKDPGRQEAVANAYNRYVADFCAADRKRLFGAALAPTATMDAALREIDAARRLGLNAVCVRPNVIDGVALHDPFYYPMWEKCQDIGMAVAVHGLADSKNLGMDRFDSQAVEYAGGLSNGRKCHSFAVEHCFVHVAEMMAAVTSFVMAGICDRFPRLRVAFVEGGAGWLAGYLDRMDRHFDDEGMNDTGLTVRPSEIFRRQCFISFEPVEYCIASLAEYLGPDKLMLSSDFPHSDGFPNAVQTIRNMKMATHVTEALMSKGFKAWYGLPT